MKAWDRDVYDQHFFVRFHDDSGPSQVMLAEEFYTTDVNGVPGSWCLQSHVREGIFCDADMSRDDDFEESWRAEIKTNIFRDVIMPRGDEFESETKISRSRRRFSERDKDGQPYI